MAEGGWLYLSVYCRILPAFPAFDEYSKLQVNICCGKNRDDAIQDSVCGGRYDHILQDEQP